MNCGGVGNTCSTRISKKLHTFLNYLNSLITCGKCHSRHLKSSDIVISSLTVIEHQKSSVYINKKTFVLLLMFLEGS